MTNTTHGSSTPRARPATPPVVQTSTGYSVLFFDSYGSVYRDTLIETSLRSADYTAWYTGVTENASYTEQSFGMRFTRK